MNAAADLRQDSLFLGRNEELHQLVRHLQRGRHSLVSGEKGVGKTRLMLEAKWVLSGVARSIDVSAGLRSRRGELSARIDPEHYRIVYVERTSPLGDCLRELAEKLFSNGDLPAAATGGERSDWHAVRKRLAGLGGARLQALIAEGIARASKPYLVFLESLDRISPGHQKFVEMLLSVAVVCTAVVHPHPAFKRIWASFVRIELAPLSDRASGDLVDRLLERYRVHVADVQLYRREILKAANGNPHVIKTLLWHGTRERFVAVGDIRKLRQAEEGHYFNMGPIYIFVVAVFTLFKIFSIGTDNREFYIYFSALGFVAFLLFRVFRAFFLFRPQKYE